MKAKLLILGCLALALVPNGQAAPATAGGSGNGGPNCFYVDLTAVATFTAAGQAGLCSWYPMDVSSPTTTFYLGATAMMPAQIGGATTFTWTIPVISGCTNAALTTVTTASGAGASSSTYSLITMTSNECKGIIQVSISTGVAPTVVAVLNRPFNIEVPMSNIAITGTLDTQARLCDHSVFGAACNTPSMNNALTGTLTIITTALADQVTILVPLLLVLILVLWAEKSKNPILYLVAILALAYTIISLWAGLVGYRESLVVVAAFLAFRLYLTAKDVTKLED